MANDHPSTLRRAAELIRTELCYGGSAHDFFEAVANFLDREAGQVERVFHLTGVENDMHGEADPAAVEIALGFLGNRA